MIALALLSPWCGYPLNAWLAGASVAGLVFGVMTLNHSFAATGLAMAIPLILLLAVAGPVLAEFTSQSRQVWGFARC